MVSWLAVHCIDSAVFGHRVCILALAWYHWRQPGVCHDGRIVVAETQPEPSPWPNFDVAVPFFLFV